MPQVRFQVIVRPITKDTPPVKPTEDITVVNGTTSNGWAGYHAVEKAVVLSMVGLGDEVHGVET